ncbi:MAG: SoxR reducing system RseC family protein [Peptococcaceae bacterium]|nr:SoxR reducing system RseC family protein [Peptococcaceae bacterium]
MPRVEEGVVIALTDEVAKIRTSKHSDCDCCGSCSGNASPILDAYNPVNAKVGQRVKFELNEEKALMAAFVVYLLPLLAAFGGYLLGLLLAQTFGLPVLYMEICGGILGLLLAVMYIKKYDKAMASKSKLPEIKEILS